MRACSIPLPEDNLATTQAHSQALDPGLPHLGPAGASEGTAPVEL